MGAGKCVVGRLNGACQLLWGSEVEISYMCEGVVLGWYKLKLCVD